MRLYSNLSIQLKLEGQWTIASLYVHTCHSTSVYICHGIYNFYGQSSMSSVLFQNSRSILSVMEVMSVKG